MDFRSSAQEIAEIEKNAAEYRPARGEAYKAERAIDISPPEILGMDYEEAVSQYNRIEKIISTAAMDIGLIGAEMRPEAPPEETAPAELSPEAQRAADRMRSISAESARETEILSRPEEEKPAIPVPPMFPPPRPMAPPAPLEAARLPEEKAPPAAPPLKKPKRPAEAPPAEKEMAAEELLPQPPPPPIEKMPPLPPRKEARPLPREEAAPFPEVEPPAALSEPPEKKAAETISRIELQLGAQLAQRPGKAAIAAGPKVDTEGAKKRMMELTRELFRERSFDRREEIKKEIVLLKNMISGERAPSKAPAKAPPAAGAFLAALKASQQYDISAAKKAIEEALEQNMKALSSQMEVEAALEKREEGVELFEKNAVLLEQKLLSMIEKYQVFLTAKHNAELSMLSAKGLSSPDSEKMREGLRESYAHEFASIKHAVGEEIHSRVQGAKEALAGQPGDPKARAIAQVSGASEEELLNLLQSRDHRTYERYARGELTRAEALTSARKRMAIEAGLDEDTINKHFGGM
ncbi:MAG: hypothetical protein QXH30_00760 [Candidatus Bilamarchaeaceae archaeon]